LTGLPIQASRILGRGRSRATQLRAAILAAFAGLLLAGCQESSIPKQLKPVPPSLVEKMRTVGMKETGAVFIRIFKESSELEVWKEKRDGTYGLLKTYQICRWSGELGPKIAEGDRQAPEGFYTVTPGQMNPKSSYYLSFNIGYPNAFDRSLGRTGSHLMVHGACSSSGCYSMTDEDAGELFALARDAFRGGQRAFQIQAFPFRMTAENMAKHRDSKHLAFWKMLKTGSDHFDVTHRPPKVDVCNKRYVFDADAAGRSFTATESCPSYTVSEEVKVAVASKQAADDTAFDAAVVRLAAEAKKAEEDERLAEEKRVADEKRAAEKAATKEARSEELQKKLGVFGRLFGGDKDEPSQAVATAPAQTEAKESPAAAYAPTPATPVPPKKPKTEAKADPEAKPEATTTAAPPAPPTVEAPIAAEAEPKPTIAPEAAQASPPVGTFVKKPFVWPGG
jgi:murein L,D-transpeptidase YafK